MVCYNFVVRSRFDRVVSVSNCLHHCFIYFFQYPVICLLCKFFVHFLLGAIMQSKKMPYFSFYRLGMEIW